MKWIILLIQLVGWLVSQRFPFLGWLENFLSQVSRKERLEATEIKGHEKIVTKYEYGKPSI
jgi:hypothetical protein